MIASEKLKRSLIGLLLIVGGLSIILLSREALHELCASPADCEASCNKGHAADCRQIGLMYFQGAGVDRSPEHAIRFLRLACDGGDGSGCTALGTLLQEGFGPPGGDPATVLTSFERACQAKDAMGCNDLANLYAHGDGVARDPARARALYDKACAQGSGMACSTLAKMFLAGEGVTQDSNQANKLFSRSAKLLGAECKNGNPRACGQVGWLFERGLGTDKDEDQAAHDYQAGCDGNDAVSCYNLAGFRRNKAADDPTIHVLIDKACQLGMREACGR